MSAGVSKVAVVSNGTEPAISAEVSLYLVHQGWSGQVRVFRVGQLKGFEIGVQDGCHAVLNFVPGRTPSQQINRYHRHV
jgi:hypothetical protein